MPIRSKSEAEKYSNPATKKQSSFSFAASSSAFSLAAATSSMFSIGCLQTLRLRLLAL